MRRLITLFLLLAAPLFAGDCVALSFTTLSMLASHPVPYETWRNNLRGTLTLSPDLSQAVATWNRHFLLSPLICCYSQVKGLRTQERVLDTTGHVPYLWVGDVPRELMAQVGDDNSHAALALFREEGVTLVHTLNAGPIEGRFYVERLSWEAFFARTYAVYEVVAALPQVPVKWGALPSSILHP